ncbi:MAG TPA: cupredoxin domain-containing protein [Aliidongia sp.]|nr:cupredoxin domain-containing protein [Aliidongia sp.]
MPRLSFSLRGLLPKPRLAALVAAGLALGLAGIGAPAQADDPTTVDLVIKDHRFTPAEIHVPAGKPTIITVHNQDPTAEEFDSTTLKVEKVVAGGGSGTVRLRPLGAGKYPFMGEYHADTAQGVVIAE